MIKGIAENEWLLSVVFTGGGNSVPSGYSLKTQQFTAVVGECQFPAGRGPSVLEWEGLTVYASVSASLVVPSGYCKSVRLDLISLASATFVSHAIVYLDNL